jgi:hypothetical protein
MSAVDNLVSLFAWNEWHEGGIIEPNKRGGCRHRDTLRAWGIGRSLLGVRWPALRRPSWPDRLVTRRLEKPRFLADLQGKTRK